MKYVLHTADSRGNVDLDWLQSRHSFSFGHYYNPERMHFGALRVLNDDIVAAGKGFDTHSHSNMEIISIPLEGELEHRDSMGNRTVIREGDIQVMSAGTGVFHSEYNKSNERPVKFLQIWVIPQKQQVEPRYGQITLHPEDRLNRLQPILTPVSEGEGVWIHQEAWFHLGKIGENRSVDYSLKKKGNGVYVFVLEGRAKIGDLELQKRDALGLWDTDGFLISALSDLDVLLMEVPL